MELKLKKKPELRFDSAKISQQLKAQLEEKKRQAAHQAILERNKQLEPRFNPPTNPLKEALLKQQQAQLIRSKSSQYQTEQGLMEEIELTYKV